GGGAGGGGAGRRRSAARPGQGKGLPARSAASYKGITKNFAFDRKTGSLVIDGRGVYLWKVDGGRFRYQGVAPFQVST
ncbi:hypothetical protein AB0H32_00005, partial [Streptomyces sp. NPDC020362]